MAEIMTTPQGQALTWEPGKQSNPENQRNPPPTSGSQTRRTPNDDGLTKIDEKYGAWGAAQGMKENLKPGVKEKGAMKGEMTNKSRGETPLNHCASDPDPITAEALKRNQTAHIKVLRDYAL